VLLQHSLSKGVDGRRWTFLLCHQKLQTNVAGLLFLSIYKSLNKLRVWTVWEFGGIENGGFSTERFLTDSKINLFEE
jgi:hypothetical protein